MCLVVHRAFPYSHWAAGNAHRTARGDCIPGGLVIIELRVCFLLCFQESCDNLIALNAPELLPLRE